MADVLSQDEINDLLKAVDNACSADKKETGDPGLKNQRLKFTSEQLGEIKIIFDKFALKAKKSLTQKLGRTVEMYAASIDQLTVDEFYRCIPIPTVLGLINMEPLKGGVIFEIDPLISFPIIDIICKRKTGTKPNRALTDDEENIMKDIYALLLENIRQAWSEISDVPSVDLRLTLKKIEPDPKFIKLAPPEEMTALITLAVQIEGSQEPEAQGMMNYCIPFPVIEPILEKLTAF